MPLTDTAVRSARPGAKPYKMGDARGLYLQVEPGGAKLWRLKYRYVGKEKKLALGAYPEVTLAQARNRQFDARRLLANGVDPSEHKKQTRRAIKLAAANTFEAVAMEWFAKFKPKWAETHSLNRPGFPGGSII